MQIEVSVFYLLLNKIGYTHLEFGIFQKMDFTKMNIVGEVKTDLLHRILYSTDASAYREMPLAVAFPKDETDVQEIVRYASKIILI